MGIPQEEAYSDGFVDGQEMILDEVIQMFNDMDFDDEYALREIKKYVMEKKKEIESL